MLSYSIKFCVTVLLATLFFQACRKSETQQTVSKQPVLNNSAKASTVQTVPPEILAQLYNDYTKAGVPEKAMQLKRSFDFSTGQRILDNDGAPSVERIVSGVGDVLDDIAFADRSGTGCLTHLGNFGWVSVDFNAMNSAPAPEAFDNTPPQPWQMMGTAGQSRRLEAFVLPRLAAFDINGNFANQEIFFRYQSHASGIGWMGQVESPQMTGTAGQSRQLEAIAIQVFPATVIIGAQQFRLRVFYRTHLAGAGWTGWTSDGGVSGTTGQGRRLEAMQVRVYLIR